MNANELIEHYQGELDDSIEMINVHEDLNKKFGGHDGLIKAYKERVERLKSLLSILSRTRIRETAAEPPTREDADKNGLILGYHLVHEMFDAYKFETIIEYRSEFPFWTQMPQPPEVTP